jgi:hypothetical protein
VQLAIDDFPGHIFGQRQQKLIKARFFNDGGHGGNLTRDNSNLGLGWRYSSFSCA